MESQILAALAEQGLSCLASAELNADEVALIASPARSVHLIGTTGEGIWPAFSQSAEFRDGGENPLDRWSKRVIGAIADAQGLTAAFPSDGPPYLPFITWALRSGAYFQSPIGLAVHRRYGLWTSFRGLLFSPQSPEQSLEQPDESVGASPCDRCELQPCRTACPIDAFDPVTGFAVTRCATAVARADVPCRETGCKARLACPLNEGRSVCAVYPKDQRLFHMDHFVRAHARDSSVE